MTPVSPEDYLAPQHLGRLPPEVQRPAYERGTHPPGIVHFGPGAFHRVHQAWFADELLARDPRWSIAAVSLRNPDVRNALEPQGGLYTLATLDQTVSFRVIGALQELLVAPESPERVLSRMSAPTTRVVTITVTEKGYCLDAAGSLDLTHPDIKLDLEHPGEPRSLIGYLVEGLRRRQESGLTALTVISCDNLVDNGVRLAGAVRQLAQLRDPGLARWIEDHTRFPRTMVDSITPATTDALRERVAEASGVHDRWPVQRESFLQWVLEDQLAPGGPDWASAGVTITDDVAAYDRAKLRLLNGAHSTLAYSGLLAGYETVAQAMQDEKLAAFIATLMREDVRPTLRAPRGLDLTAYIEAILRRFRNPAIHHALAQIACDGSQKLPFRLMGTIAENLEAGRRIDRLCVPVAAWMHFVRRQAARGERVTDPLATRLFEIGRACQNRASQDLPLFLALQTVFPANLVQAAPFSYALARAYDDLAVE
jgi:fructuronate reductase